MRPLLQNAQDDSVARGSSFQAAAPISHPGGKRLVPQFGQIGRSPSSFPLQFSSSRVSALFSIKAASNLLTSSRAFSSISRKVASGLDLFHLSISTRISPLKSFNISSSFICLLPLFLSLLDRVECSEQQVLLSLPTICETFLILPLFPLSGYPPPCKKMTCARWDVVLHNYLR